MVKPKGPVIEAMRKRRGLSRAKLAERVESSYSHIYNIERGFKDAKEELLQRIANELGVDIKDVMFSPAEAAA
jgi:transcriptional regulator with XRE-family HTH domain